MKCEYCGCKIEDFEIVAITLDGNVYHTNWHSVDADTPRSCFDKRGVVEGTTLSARKRTYVDGRLFGMPYEKLLGHEFKYGRSPGGAKIIPKI